MTLPIRRPARFVPALLLVSALVFGTSPAVGQKPARRSEGITPQRRLDLRARRPVARRSQRLATDRILVRFRPETPEALAEGLIQSYGFRAVRKIPRVGVYALKTPAGLSLAETLAMVRRSPYVEEARPDYRTRLTDVPNDSYLLGYQYNLRNPGGSLDLGGGIVLQARAGSDIKALTAWDETHGNSEVVIAVLDSGVDMTHPDLADKVVSAGRDFANDDDDATDDHFHGTHVAGIAAADTDNGLGIAGVAWDCRILPVKVVEADGSGYYSWMIEGIIWAADQGAKVINLSVGGDADDSYLEEACQYAFEKGAVLVASAGNENGPVLYPAAYDSYVLAVAASDYSDARASFSNFGPEVDVAAPGVYILGPAPQWYVGEGYLPYLFVSGTSQAAPHVSGLAALLVSLKPGLEPAEVMKIIRYTADDVNASTKSGRDDDVGYGRINMTRALAPYILK